MGIGFKNQNFLENLKSAV